MTPSPIEPCAVCGHTYRVHSTGPCRRPGPGECACKGFRAFVDTPVCKVCGNPLDRHPFRHPFCAAPEAPTPEQEAAIRQPEERTKLYAIVNKLEPDAVRALVIIGERLLKGQAYYGKLDIATDLRTWHKEREEELQDALIYGAFASLKDQVK